MGVATKGLGTIEAEKVVSVTGGTFEKTTDEEAGENTSYVGIAELIPRRRGCGAESRRLCGRSCAKKMSTAL